MTFLHLGVGRSVFHAAFALFSGAVTSGFAQFPDAPRDPLPPLPERRAQVLKEFDADKDGHLGAAEREISRKAWATRQLTRRERGMFGPPPEIMEEFDKNKDGELDDAEGRAAMETMGKRMEKVRTDYDKDKDGKLSPEEIAAAMKDVDDGKLKGVPRMFIQFAGGPPGGRGRGPGGPGGRGGPGGPRGGGQPMGASDAPGIMEKADADHDGRLDAQELGVARAELARRRALKSNATATGEKK